MPLAARPPKPAIWTAGTISDRLPRLSFAEAFDLWIAYCEVLANPTLAHRHQNALRILWAIEDDWERRTNLADASEYFKWPKTEVVWGDGEFSTDSMLMLGVLRLMGYQVGQTNGKADSDRIAILNRVYKLRLPPVLSQALTIPWSLPNSGPRLQKMAESIAIFTRNAKGRRAADLSQAISEWERDLKYLRREFYEGVYDFPYPET
jgi:hypothetical protein